MADTIDGYIADIAEALGITEPNGGYRVRLRETLERIIGESRVSLATTVTEATGRPNQVAKGRAESDSVSELRGWWEQTAHDEIGQLTAKMIEYGGLSRATDLAEIGRGLINSGVKAGLEKDSDDEEAMYQELGVYFYLLGKFARWTAAVAEGRPVSDDTLLDIGIYVRMAQRIRHTGGWPV